MQYNLRKQSSSSRKVRQGCICAETCRFFVLQGLSITSSAEERSPYQPPYFLRHKQDCFFQTFGLAASSAPQCLCDLHYSEVSNPLTTSGSDKTPSHLEVSQKAQTTQPQLVSCLMNNDEWMNKYCAQRNVHRLICCALLREWNCRGPCYMDSIRFQRELKWLVHCGTLRRFGGTPSNSCGHCLKSGFRWHKCSSAIP